MSLTAIGQVEGFLREMYQADTVETWCLVRNQLLQKLPILESVAGRLESVHAILKAGWNGSGIGMHLFPLKEEWPSVRDGMHEKAWEELEGIRRELRTSRGKRRRTAPRISKRLTSKETEAMFLVGEHKGNVTAASKIAGVSRQAMKKRYDNALKKLGETAQKKGRTRRLHCGER